MRVMRNTGDNSMEIKDMPEAMAYRAMADNNRNDCWKPVHPSLAELKPGKYRRAGMFSPWQKR